MMPHNKTMLMKYMNRKEIKEYMITMMDYLFHEQYGAARSMLVRLMSLLRDKEEASLTEDIKSDGPNE